MFFNKMIKRKKDEVEFLPRLFSLTIIITIYLAIKEVNKNVFEQTNPN